MWEYKNRTNKGFAFKYNLDRLVWYEGLETRDDAFVAERQMKAWKRAWKIEAIEKLNPNWDDLALHL
jgi:putative endonuclease